MIFCVLVIINFILIIKKRKINKNIIKNGKAIQCTIDETYEMQYIHTTIPIIYFRYPGHISFYSFSKTKSVKHGIMYLFNDNKIVMQLCLRYNNNGELKKLSMMI